ncbi:TIGR03943 family putative permease subunit [Halalkalibacter urbisdiaboli]|uniref:TIGR03943 family putative permease subunit n=1 Tax=Halalkalibacter urbisdiaboli TaxID=1960589 RepID=UPI0013FE1CFD|nr:TIGR03943 family protein [Halalkalibacter urbisdiaboli]
MQGRQALKAFVLLLFSVFIFILHHNGEIARFVNPDYLYFSQIASVLFMFLFFVQVPRIFSEGTEHDHSQCGPWGCDHDGEELSLRSVLSYAVITLPLLTGLFFPYKEFGAAEALNRGISYTSLEHEHYSEDDKKVQEMLDLPVLDFTNEQFASYIRAVTTYPQLFAGKSIEIEGFLLEDDYLSQRHTVIARFLVTHCVADAHVTGLIIDGVSLQHPNDTWVRVKGNLHVKRSGDLLIPAVNVSSIEEIAPPVVQYVYP